MKTILRWAVISALFVIPFLPLYIASDLFFPFITGKNFAFRILVEIALAAYVVLAVVDARYRPKFSWMLVLFASFVSWMAIANTLGVHPLKAFWSNFERMDGWVTLIHLFGFFVVAGAVLGVEKLWRTWWLTYVGVAALVCIHAFTGLTSTGLSEGIRLAGTLGNAIYLAVYVLFALFAAAWLALSSSGWTRVALLGFMPIGTLVLFLTGSRGPLLGLIAGVVCAAGAWLVLSHNEWRKGVFGFGTKIAAAFLAIVLLAGGGLYAIKDTSFVQNNYMLSRAATVFSLGDALAVRSTLWGIGLEGVREHPVTGVGQEGFNQIFNAHYLPELYEQESWFDRAHNLYVDWLVAGGVPAFVLFVALLILTAVAIVRAREWTRGERVLMLAALVAYGVQALVVFDNLFSYVPLVVLMAMAHAASAKPVHVLEDAPELTDDTGVYSAVGGALILVIVIVWMINVPHIRAANYLAHALSLPKDRAAQSLEYFEKALATNTFATQEIREQLLARAMSAQQESRVPEQVRKQLAERALEEMQKENDLSPNDARLRLQLASAYALNGNEEEALAELQRALVLSPNKQSIRIPLAMKLHQLGKIEEARTLLKETYELDTSFANVGISAATGLIMTGDTKGGKELLVQATGTTTPDSESLLYAYYETKQWDDFIAVAYARVIAQRGSPESRIRYAEALAAAGRVAAARAELRDIVEEYPAAQEMAAALLERINTATR